MALIPLTNISNPVTLANADPLRVNAEALGVRRGITEQQRVALSCLFKMYDLYNETGSTDYVPTSLATTSAVLGKLIADANALTQGFELCEFSTLTTAIDYGASYSEAAHKTGVYPSTSVETLIAQTAPLWQLPIETLNRIYLLLQYRCIQKA